MPVGYDRITTRTYGADGASTSVSELWRPLACLVLDAAYEATLAVAALLAAERGVRVTCYLTKVGGGVFANEDEWIVRAMQVRVYVPLCTSLRAPLCLSLPFHPTNPPLESSRTLARTHAHLALSCSVPSLHTGLLPWT